jgi:hypothetical protein
VREGSDRTPQEKESGVVQGCSVRTPPEKGLGVLRFANVRIPEENERGVLRGAIARITEHNKTQIKEDSWNRAERTDAGPKRKLSGTKTVTKDKIINHFCGHDEMII